LLARLLQNVHDSPLKAAFFVLLFLIYVAPLALIVTLLWKRRTWHRAMPGWRWRVWNSGLALGALTALALPLFLLGIQFLSNAAKQKWFIDAGTKGMLFALIISPIAVILFGFGKGRQRWIGIVSGLLPFAGLYITLLAASF
jgi:hypothetical protein